MAAKKKKESQEQEIGLFDEILEDTNGDTVTIKHGNQLEVFECECKGVKTFDTWQYMFNGYTDAKVITFSFSSLSIARFMRETGISSCEIIFGSEHVYLENGREINDIVKCVQCAREVILYNEKGNMGYIEQNIRDGKLKIHIARQDMPSHEKIYLLRGRNDETGTDKFRTIIGSANMTLTGLGGFQREVIAVVEGELMYNIMLERFEAYRDSYTVDEVKDSITVDTKELLESGNVDNIGIIEKVKAEKVVVLDNIEKPTDKEVKVYNVIAEASKDTDELLDKIKVPSAKKDKKGTLRFTSADAKEFVKKAKSNAGALRETHSAYPYMRVTEDNLIPCINGQFMDLENIDMDKVRNDIRIICSFFNGYERCKFRGKVLDAKQKYFATMNYCFIAPYLHIFLKHCISPAQERAYPIFLLLRGDKSAGKSPLMDFCLRLMLSGYGINFDNAIFNFHDRKKIEDLDGKSIKVSDYVNSRINQGQGLPVMMDELYPKIYATSVKDCIKGDNRSRIDAFSPIVFASNDVLEFEPNIQKRFVVFNINMAVEDSLADFANKLDALKQMLSGELYKYFLSQFIVRLPGMLEHFDEINNVNLNALDGNDEDKDEELVPLPDIFECGSEVLKEIFDELCDDKSCEDYVKVYRRDYYRHGNANRSGLVENFTFELSHGMWRVDLFGTEQWLVREFDTADLAKKDTLRFNRTAVDVGSADRLARVRYEYAKELVPEIDKYFCIEEPVAVEPKNVEDEPVLETESTKPEPDVMGMSVMGFIKAKIRKALE